MPLIIEKPMERQSDRHELFKGQRVDSIKRYL